MKLVFLHLLERQPEAVGEVGLTHVQHQAAHADPLTDVLVCGVGRLVQGAVCFRAEISREAPSEGYDPDRQGHRGWRLAIGVAPSDLGWSTVSSRFKPSKVVVKNNIPQRP
jgi:hypothetical protein